ncbi:MAG TPA: M28 family peptidase [Saprospiraceae bacterium]|nr:M28 family peptidase [Saprospiraceae bacterium]
MIADNQIPALLSEGIREDSLRYYLENLVAYRNRNTVSDDSLRPDEGIRGARSWIRTQLDRWAQRPGSSLITSEFDFDFLMCQKLRHRQLFAVIPGTGPLRSEAVIVEAHLDSRCENLCDPDCLAEGADDNGSGSVLLMELARVLSEVSINRTLVLLWVTGEEQGLGGSRSFATWCKQNGIQLKAVFNNDIVGGIECGLTSSPPGCPGPNQFDSLRFRIFSAGNTNSMHKNLARQTRILVEEKLHKANLPAPQIDVMFGEDRSGRGSDHISFREQGYTALRFTSSYEHGDGNPSQPGYSDRQHSTRDVLGKDIDGDGDLDSFYVHFNYLKNNAVVNALSAVNSGSTTLNPMTMKVTPGAQTIDLEIENPQQAVRFIFGIRKINMAYFDTLVFSDLPYLTLTGLTPTQYYVTACGVDSAGWIGMFGPEYNVRVLSGVVETDIRPAIELLQNQPNPFDEQTLIPIVVNDASQVKEARLEVHAGDGRLVKSLDLELHSGLNEVLYDLSWQNYECGLFYYSLKINGRVLATRTMLLIQY